MPFSVHFLASLLNDEPDLQLAVLFGSLTQGIARAESDIDLAVTTGHPMPPQRRQDLADRLAAFSGRAVDLIDLATQSGPLLGNILRHGTIVLQRDPSIMGRLYVRFLDWQEDLAPAVRDMLATRRKGMFAQLHG